MKTTIGFLVYCLVSLIFMFLLAIVAVHAETPCTGTSTFIPYPIYGNPRVIQPIPLPAGKWDCVVGIEAKADKAAIQAMQVSMSQIANKMDQWPRTATSGPNGGPGYGLSLTTPPIRIENPEAKTFYVNALVYFTGGTIQLQSSYFCTNITISN